MGFRGGAIRMVDILKVQPRQILKNVLKTAIAVEPKMSSNRQSRSVRSSALFAHHLQLPAVSPTHKASGMLASPVSTSSEWVMSVEVPVFERWCSGVVLVFERLLFEWFSLWHERAMWVIFLWRDWNMKMWKCENVKMWKCENVKIIEILALRARTLRSNTTLEHYARTPRTSSQTTISFHRRFRSRIWLCFRRPWLLPFCKLSTWEHQHRHLITHCRWWLEFNLFVLSV